MMNDSCSESVFIATISKLPDGKFTVSTAFGTALSEAELRQELRLRHPAPLVDDLMYRLRRLI